MLKLIVNPGTDQAWEIPLPPGVTVLGSDPASPFAIAHDTVAPAHCEIHVAPRTVTIRDLGSAYGTFVNHAPVTEAGLVAGQSISLGEVQLQVVADSPDGGQGPANPPIPVRIPTPVRASVMAATPKIESSACCKFHRKAVATWHCGVCAAWFCDICVNARRVGESVRHLCRKCGNECGPVAVQYTVPEEENFYKSLPSAFRYPFRGHGLVLIIAGAFFFTVAHFAAGFIGIVGLGVGLFTAGYLANYVKAIVATSAQGSNEPPDWPDFSNWSEDILQPAGQMLALIALTFGPSIILAVWHPFDKDPNRLAVLATAAVGALIAPMGMLALAVLDHVGALNPVVLVWSICRIPLPYLVAAATFEGVLVAYLAVGGLTELVSLPSILTSFIQSLLELYALSAGMRILGLLYRTNADKLGWA